MKYIRTIDDEVRTTARLYKNEDGSYSNANREVFGLPKIIIVKEADTIEELCDEFLYVPKEDGNRMFHVSGRPTYSKFGVTYGAIWTEWGIKKVAKINEKGDFELL